MARYKGRATRLSEAMSAINLAPLEDAIEAVETYVAFLDVRADAIEDAKLAPIGETETPPEATPPTYDPQDAVTDANCAAESVGELYDEIDNWKSNMEGTNHENTQKYNDLDECASALETIKDALEAVSAPTKPTDPLDRDAWSAYHDELEELRDGIQEGLDGESDVMFPGLYG